MGFKWQILQRECHRCCAVPFSLGFDITLFSMVVIYLSGNLNLLQFLDRFSSFMYSEVC